MASPHQELDRDTLIDAKMLIICTHANTLNLVNVLHFSLERAN